MSEEKIYQPGWGEKTKHHHRRGGSRSNMRDKNIGGALRMRDKQAYIGLVLVLVGGAVFGLYLLVHMFVKELRAMPNDDPETEMAVDELRIHKVEEQDALLLGDSLARHYNVDSLKRQVQIETRPVYRPPRKNTEWYITSREWKAIWKNYRIWKRMKEKEEEENKQ